MVKNNTHKVIYARDFEFYSTPEEVSPLINRVVAEIREEILNLDERVSGKCRLILTELLTNALKHSDCPKTVIGVMIDKEKIQISKLDSGRAFYLPEWKEREALKWPLEGREGQKIVIYEDQMCCLFGQIENQNKVVFSHEDYSVQMPPRPKDILEHFGLMILTKSSDSFIYHYNPATKTNLFQAEILL